MPITYYIDHTQRLVVARGSGTFTDADVFGYQREVWSRSDVAGYNELVDMSAVKVLAIPMPAKARVLKLAAESAASDPPELPSKFAIVAPDELAFGMGRMYQSYRELDPRSTKQVGVFRTLTEALEFLGVKALKEPEAPPDSPVQQPSLGAKE